MRRSSSWAFFAIAAVTALASACGSSGNASQPGDDAGTGVRGGDGGSSSGSSGGSSGGGSGGTTVGPDGGPVTGNDAAAGGDGAIQTDVPIKHVVVIVKENHTFDNYFGSFPGAEGTTTCQTTMGAIAAPHAPDKTPRDLCHEHTCALQDYDGGKMDGWLGVSGASTNNDNLFCAQYQQADLPNYWTYAQKFALADHFFANVLGPSFPGHTFMLAAQAGWATGNPGSVPYWGCDSSSTVSVLDPKTGCASAPAVAPCFNIPSVPTLLPSGADWKFYGTSFYVLTEIWSMFDAISPIRNSSLWGNVVNASTFDSDVTSGKLPAVTWLVDQDFNDEHPNIGGVCAGENWTVGHINTLMASQYWKDTAILFTMDDFGGWYDHVKPPRQYGCDAANPYGLGFRLPLIVMSPYVKQGVYKTQAEQASVAKFLLTVFKAGKFLTDLDPAAQDKQANDLMDMFDWNQTPLPPVMLTQRTCP